MNSPFTIWVITDGKPGHQNQSLGLAEAFARRVPCQIHQICLTAMGGLGRRLFAAIKASRSLPKPDLVIGTGHATHIALLWFARRHRAKSIVLMKPSLPISWFDHCIAPEHDFPNGTKFQNVILSKGALNRIVPGTGEKSGKLILIGGPSKTHGWDAEAVMESLRTVAGDGPWTLTSSRRTPPDVIRVIRKQLPHIEVFSHEATDPQWLPAQLTSACEVWVTEDSVSMIYEALSSGASVGLLPVPRSRPSSRVLVGLDNMATEGFITLLSDWKKSGRLETPPSILREADRCAETIARRL